MSEKANLKRAIVNALEPGRFIAWRGVGDFIEELDEVREELLPMGDADGQPAEAAELLETFIAGCYEKADEIDDSSAEFCVFVTEIYADWIRARQAAGADPAETAAALLSWWVHDDYGFCGDLHSWGTEALDRDGLEAMDLAARALEDVEPRFASGMLEIRKSVRERLGDTEAFVALCEDAGGACPADCEVLAGMFRLRGRPEEALAWADRGLEMERQGDRRGPPAWALDHLRRDLLKELGRDAEAAGSAWSSFVRAPCGLAFEALMETVKPEEREAWKARALEAISEADPYVRLELLLVMEDRDRLAEMVAATPREWLSEISHHLLEPAAGLLPADHPVLAAKLEVAMALRLVEARKSRYYDVALERLQRARDLLLANGGQQHWDDLTEAIRVRHGAQYGFMPGFERLVAGEDVGVDSEFLERIDRRLERGSPEA